MRQHMRGAALFSADGRYRYALARRWAAGPSVCFVMLNPSTADASRDDPTIRRCIGFARAWGFSGLVVVNLFAYRSPAPRALACVPDAVGPENDRQVRRACRRAGEVIVAWGAHRSAARRVDDVLRLIGPRVRCLALTKSGAPRHPLFMPARATPRPFPSLLSRQRGSGRIAGVRAR